ncbi:hypothetical protein HDC34_003381 [Pseudoclavibacter sp. JAI123]|nr:hypothetical protein [Pseudoclavibacter sp. JAI123]
MPADEGEPRAEFTERLYDTKREPLLKFALARVRVDRKEVEGIRVFGELLGKLRVGAFQR